jgi:hypothetical protein
MTTIKNKNELHIAFSLGSIIDTKKAEEVLEKKGVSFFQETLKKYRDSDSIFDPGPSLGFFMALRKLNRLIPDDVLKIKFALISKIDPNPNISSVILNSMKHYLEDSKEETNDFGFDVIMLTNGKDTTFCHRVFKTDLMFTTDNNNARTLFQNNFPVVCIPNISKENNKALYEKREENIVLFSDYDGVIGDAKGETIFQDALSKNIDPVNAFLDYEKNNEHLSMDLGPLGNFIQKMGRVVKYQKYQQLESGDNINLFNTILITARSGQAKNRLLKTLEINKIEISELYMLQGQNKNYLLSELGEIYKGYNLLFFDDSEIHFKRSQELREIVSGWVPNQENIERIKNE